MAAAQPAAFTVPYQWDPDMAQHALIPGMDNRQAVTAAPRRATAAPSGPAADRRPDWMAVAPAAVTLAVMLWGIGAPAYWGDEVDTVSAVSRSLPQLVRLLGHVDAVHGLYYLLLWPVARLAGTGEIAMRLPSALAMAAACLGVTVIARRLRSREAGFYAGLVFAALPAVTQQGHDARPYAMLTAAVVLASYLLLRLAADARPGWLIGYGCSLVLVGYMQLFGLLIVAAHAVTLLSWRTRRVALRAWLAVVTASGVAVLPLAVLGWRQRAQIAWITMPGWYDLRYLLGYLGGGSLWCAGVLTVLAVTGAACGDRAASGQTRLPQAAEATRPGSLAWLALPWLAVPPAALWAASLAYPVYSVRYITFCLPAGALLAGAGFAAADGPVAAGALAGVVALSAPAQLAIRVPRADTEAGALQAVTRVLASHERPGDAIVYPGGAIPPWSLAYPRGFSRLRDLSLAEPGAQAGTLYGRRVPMPVLWRRERGVRRIFVVEAEPPWVSPVRYLAPGFRLTWQVRPAGTTARVWLYTR
jgi:mannosyltransferase